MLKYVQTPFFSTLMILVILNGFDALSEPVDGFDRCPLCRNLVNKNKWREHLMGEYPCPKNPRSQILKTCKYIVNFFTLEIS